MGGVVKSVYRVSASKKARGLAATIPEFRRRGLCMSEDCVWYCASNGARFHGTSAGTEFFGLLGHGLEGWDELFVPVPDEFHASPKYVAKKIRRFVARARAKALKAGRA